MRVTFIAFFVFALSLAATAQRPRGHRSATPAPQHNLEEDQKAIADLQRRDIDANIAVDTDKIMALRTGDVVYLVPGRSPLVGQDAVRNYLEEIRRQLADWDMIGYEEQWQEVQVVGDFAFEWGTINIRARQENEKRESTAVRNVIQVLKRQPDGDWKIARAIWNLQAPQASPPPPSTKPPDKPKE
ncbi:MAG: YybH family protein [Terriglobales bacterium]